MRFIGSFKHRIIIIIFPSFLGAISLHAQGQKPPAGKNQEQVGQTIRVHVGLVQTDVMVFDKRGDFVPGLKMDQFELRVDGKSRPVSFMELVSAGSPHDEKIWAKAENRTVAPAAQPAAKTSNPGRTLLFFVDDWHMAEENVVRLRSALRTLIDTSVGPTDLVALAAASGQLGSVHQLTNNKAAVLETLKKLNYVSPGVQDLARPPMTEAQALEIERNDWDMITYFVQGMTGQPFVRTNQGWVLLSGRTYTSAKEADEAEKITRRRATELAQMSAGIGQRTISALRGFLQAAEGLPGRRTVFFLSDGFVLQTQNSDITQRIWDLTTAAAGAGIVIYTLDSRGLVVGLPDAKTKRAPDFTGAAAHAAVNEVTAGQDALNALAADTGGRFLKNTNALDTALATALSEMSRYYLLGWYVEPEKLQPGKYSTIKASIKGRSDLTVRVRQGSLDLSQLVAKDKK
jgi:VWFA-related protein